MGWTKFDIKKIIKHPNFNLTFWENNIAILELDEEIQYNSYKYSIIIKQNQLKW